MPNAPRGPNLIVGSRTEIFSVRFVIEGGTNGDIPGTIFNVAETEVGTPAMIVPDGWLFSPMYLEIDGTPNIHASLKALKNGSVMFGGKEFDVHRIVNEEGGIIEVGNPPLLNPGDRLEFYLELNGVAKKSCMEEVLVHMVIAPERSLRV